MEECAARSSGSFPEVMTSPGSPSGTTPLRKNPKLQNHAAPVPSRADSGMAAYQLRLTLASTRPR